MIGCLLHSATGGPAGAFLQLYVTPGHPWGLVAAVVGSFAVLTWYLQRLPIVPPLHRPAWYGPTGGMRLWLPDPLRSKGQVLLSGVICAGSLHHLYLAVDLPPGKRVEAAGLAACCLLGLGMAIQEYRKPAVIATDEAGIIITSGKGCLWLPWEEVVSVERMDTWSLRVNADRVQLSLGVYSGPQRKELFSLILHRARLQQTPYNDRLYVRLPT